MIQKHIKLLLLLVSISFASYSNAQHDDHSGHNHEMEDKVAEVLVEADNQNVNTETEEKYSPTATIMHHIADANEFHLFGHTSIPLPVILYSSVKGFTFIFSVILLCKPPLFFTILLIIHEAAEPQTINTISVLADAQWFQK